MEKNARQVFDGVLSCLMGSTQTKEALIDLHFLPNNQQTTTCPLGRTEHRRVPPSEVAPLQRDETDRPNQKMLALLAEYHGSPLPFSVSAFQPFSFSKNALPA